MPDSLPLSSSQETATPSAVDVHVREFVKEVVRDWRAHWAGTDHRYGVDFAAFLGEVLLTHFNISRETVPNTPLPPELPVLRDEHIRLANALAESQAESSALRSELERVRGERDALKKEITSNG